MAKYLLSWQFSLEPSASSTVTPAGRGGVGGRFGFSGTACMGIQVNIVAAEQIVAAVCHVISGAVLHTGGIHIAPHDKNYNQRNNQTNRKADDNANCGVT